MRVAANQLLAAVLGHRGKVALVPLLEQQRQEVDLEQDVAQLVEHLHVVARVGGVGQLIRLLNRVRHDRALVLLAVPRALAPQPARDLVQRDQGAGGLPGAHLPVEPEPVDPPEGWAGVPLGAAPEPGAVLVEFALALGAFLQLSITKSLAQSVSPLYFFW